MDEIKNPRIGLIVCAAGAARRMREPKQLLKYRGLTLLRRAAETALATNCQPVVVVLGANFERMNDEIKDLPVAVCFNRDFENGLSSSIVGGLRKILEIEPEISAVIVTLADQPFVTAANLNSLITEFADGQTSIVAAAYDQKIGVPALFARSLFGELFQLQGDRGARRLLRGNRYSIEKIQMPEASADIDTPEQFAELNRI